MANTKLLLTVNGKEFTIVEKSTGQGAPLRGRKTAPNSTRFLIEKTLSMKYNGKEFVTVQNSLKHLLFEAYENDSNVQKCGMRFLHRIGEGTEQIQEFQMKGISYDAR